MKRPSPIAIVGMACRYPDADTVDQLFENALAQRRAFRRIPGERLARDGYFDCGRESVDRSYADQAAVIRDFAFDRERFCVPRSSYEVTDLTHWLALTVAGETLEDIRCRRDGGVPPEGVRVVVGNTLTGEFSRSQLLRLRWPYVRGVVARQLAASIPDFGHGADGHQRFLAELEQAYKQPFATPNEDSLAGGLANTIAGRICNHFDFRGGGFTIDAACASSLLAVADGCSALASGEASLVLAGGVDLSLDPFELVGFSRTAALARGEMLVYDEHSQGFWPGEGCGFVALMRLEEAVERRARIHAVIAGWGVSSDGRGGLTRPEASGQRLALQRAYRRAGYGIESVTYFEGHGTGTKVGDAAELEALIGARGEASGPPAPAVISSIKANIGHTKAAAGLAGLLRATRCLEEQVLPPTTACLHPHPLFEGNEDNLAPSDRIRPWEPLPTRRAGVSAMGFGGINTHVTLEEYPAHGRTPWFVRQGAWNAARFDAAAQDTELFLFSADDRTALLATLRHLSGFADRLSRAELTDLAVELARRAVPSHPVKAAVVAATAEVLASRLKTLAEAVESGRSRLPQIDAGAGIFLADGTRVGRIGFLFSGQGCPARADGGIHARRFGDARTAFDLANLGSFSDRSGTDFVQPAIAAASLAGIAILERAGIHADLAVGHSFGEVTALHWAGCFDGKALMSIAVARGRAMREAPETRGTMAAIGAGLEETLAAIADAPGVSVANVNAPRQTVISGPDAAIEALVGRLRSQGISAVPLRVAHAFHTPAMEAALPAFTNALDRVPLQPPARQVVSTVTGAPARPQIDVACHLARQVVSPVRFLEAVDAAARDVDLFLEVGPGEVASRLAQACCDVPAIPLDIGGDSLAGCLGALAAAWVLHRATEHAHWFDDRFSNTFDWNWSPTFFRNPCENHPPDPASAVSTEVESVTAGTDPARSTTGTARSPKTDVGLDEEREPAAGDTRERVRRIIARHTGLPSGSLKDERRMLSDLHLNSITVGEIVSQAAVAIGLSAPVDPTEYADASIAEIAEALDQLAGTRGGGPAPEAAPPGLGTWVRCFEATRRPAPPHRRTATAGMPSGPWHWFGPRSDPWAPRLLEDLQRTVPGGGVVCRIGRHPDATDLPGLLDAARVAGRMPPGSRLVVIQNGWGASGFARTFFLEYERIVTLVINLPEDHETDDATILREIESAGAGFDEIFLEPGGARKQACVRLVPLRAGVRPRAPVVNQGDVVLVTGGGRGISAECGFHLACRTGCTLLVVGRSDPADSPELAANLERFRKAGIRLSYHRADVTDARGLAAAVADGVSELGAPVTGVVHGAGRNEPCLISSLSPEAMEATVRPKVEGLRNLLAAVDPDRLRLLVAFGSIIARSGMRGEADYALANEWLGRAIEDFQETHPDCRCRAIEWSVWSGTGMGQRLGRIDALVGQGISPLSIDDGVREFLRLVETPGLPACLMVTGRFGSPPTIVVDHPPLRPFRFLEEVPVHYPGAELVAECRPAPESDPYLDDHVLDSERLFPAVMALEAMAEAASALAGRQTPPDFLDVAFRQALVASPGGASGEPWTLRVTAVVDEEDEETFSVAIRSSTTGFCINHVEARCRFADRETEPPGSPPPSLPTGDIQPFDPGRSLYRNVLFQDGRFRRVRGYQRIEARRCCGSLSPDGTTRWFSADLPQECLLGDPGARDGALHAIQACIPHRVVIPIAVERIETGVLNTFRPHRVVAEEIEDRGNELVYDLAILDGEDRPVERWRRLTLRLVGDPPAFRLDAPPLAAPFLERRIADLVPEALLRVDIAPVAAEAPRTTRPSPDHRPDGKPSMPPGGGFRSAAYAAPWKLAVESTIPVGCDLQDVPHRDRAVWEDLLGSDGLALAEFVARHAEESLDISATRVWTAREALKKAGVGADAPMALDPGSSPEWLTLTSGSASVFSSRIDAADDDAPTLCVATALVRNPRPPATGEHDAPPAPEPRPQSEPNDSPAFEYRHVVGFQETNVVGNVYYVNHVAWQGRCREMFLRTHCPDVVDQLQQGLILATCRCSCEYLHELHAFDDILVRMRLGAASGNRVEMTFDYLKISPDGRETLAAKGVQEIACMRVVDGTPRPEPVPASLMAALEPYRRS